MAAFNAGPPSQHGFHPCGRQCTCTSDFAAEFTRAVTDVQSLSSTVSTLREEISSACAALQFTCVHRSKYDGKGYGEFEHTSPRIERGATALHGPGTTQHSTKFHNRTGNQSQVCHACTFTRRFFSGNLARRIQNCRSP